MKAVVSFGMSLIVFLAGVQSSSSKSATPAPIQNRDTVQSLYGRPVSEVYRTSQNLMVTASFGPNGNLCRAHIKSAADAGITDAQLNAVLDELAPKDVRGKFKMDTFLDITCLKLLKPENSTSGSSGRVAIDPCAECSGRVDSRRAALRSRR